jgi:hypothetical protein
MPRGLLCGEDQVGCRVSEADGVGVVHDHAGAKWRADRAGVSAGESTATGRMGSVSSHASAALTSSHAQPRGARASSSSLLSGGFPGSYRCLQRDARRPRSPCVRLSRSCWPRAGQGGALDGQIHLLGRVVRPHGKLSITPQRAITRIPTRRIGCQFPRSPYTSSARPNRVRGDEPIQRRRMQHPSGSEGPREDTPASTCRS